jgi:hypothetical protein
MKSWVAIAAVAALPAIAAQAGVYIETQESSKATDRPGQMQRMYVQDGAARIEQGNGKDSAEYVIFRNDTLYVIDPAKKRYTELDRETIRTIGGAVNSAMEQMREELAKLSPEQRAMVEQMMGSKANAMMAGSGPKPVVAAKDTGQSDTVDGRKCADWEITRDGKRSETLCVVPFSSVPGKEDLLDLAKRMRSLVEELTGALAEFGGSVNDLELMDAVQGFPVRIREYDENDALQNEVLLKSWREEEFPAARFEIPAGYEKHDIKSEVARK